MTPAWSDWLFVAGCFVVSLSVAGRISAPIVEISRAARRITGGEISQRVQIDRRDEIGELARSVNESPAFQSEPLIELRS